MEYGLDNVKRQLREKDELLRTVELKLKAMEKEKVGDAAELRKENQLLRQQLGKTEGVIEEGMFYIAL